MSALSAPLVSWIVLSYNYAHTIGETIRSILAQTVQDFEIVVVDDASSDHSCDLVRGFGDPRIRLIENPRNLGGAGSYNVAVQAARGVWLANLDADDWVTSNKIEKQLRAADQDYLDVCGSFVHFVDEAGAILESTDAIDEIVNRERNLHLVDSWLAQNPLCRSSTIVRREAHLRIGFDDPAMVRAPDYELWTRALRCGCRFAVLPEKLTFYRVHAGGVTHADPAGTLLELAWAMHRNLLPLAEERALWPSVSRIVDWVASHPHLGAIGPEEAVRLIGMLATMSAAQDYSAFRAALARPDAVLEAVGRRVIAVGKQRDGADHMIRKLLRDIELFQEAREYFRERSERYENEVVPKLQRDVEAITAERDSLRQGLERPERWRLWRTL